MDQAIVLIGEDATLREAAAATGMRWPPGLAYEHIQRVAGRVGDPEGVRGCYQLTAIAATVLPGDGRRGRVGVQAERNEQDGGGGSPPRTGRRQPDGQGVQ